ncbi:LRR receptor-like serine/threonine-protein kinase [Populus alba x Populus x berolinensis]|nr:LRR receptor-like serine/threonine-protein kinase [Populus alba x Populus x berolinensis]
MVCSAFCFRSFVLLLSLISVTCSNYTNETDLLALIQFKNKIVDDPLGIMSSWNSTIHFCQWYGVSCGRRHQRVRVLALQSLKLSGTISPHIGNLSFLRELHLQNNSFFHEIPPQVGRLRSLQIFSLHNNSISGQIPPSISDCSNLVSIKIEYNNLTGEIPMELGSLLKLKILTLEVNGLTGTIPPSLGNLSSLEILRLEKNKILFGNVPSTLGKLKNLRILNLMDNRFSGVIPPSIFNLSSLTGLDIGFNLFHGNLPSDIGISLPNLEFFSIASNQFTGSIPVSISNASNIELLQVSLNNLTGEVPTLEKLHRLNFFTLFSNHLGSGQANDLSFLSSLTNATTLEYLSIKRNNFGGELPKQIRNLSTMLGVISLQENNIFGSIPAGIEKLVNLKVFDVGSNKISGIIPSSIGEFPNLEGLILDYNNLSGHIPSSVGNLTKLMALHLGENSLEGSIPSSLGNCKKLLVLNLCPNNLSGDIPPELFGIFSLLYICFSQNHFSGSLPIEIGKLINLGILDVSGNMLSGEIPSSLGGCTSLEGLYMNSNFFHGSIPSALSSLRGVLQFNFSHNNLSGKIPEFFQGFNSLEMLDLSYNNFEGMIPDEGIFKNSTAVSVIGNSQLCGGNTEFGLPGCKFHQPKRRKLKLKIAISAIAVFLALALVVTCLFLCSSRRKRREIKLSSMQNELLEASYQILLKATTGFSSANLVGIGSFGSVYKGILDQNGMVIAVKVLNLMRQGASRSFIAECEALRNIRHRNLVKVLTACSSIDYHGNDFKAIVYEFMANGSLEDWLHPPGTGGGTTLALDLRQRLNIAIDVACALEYLHHHCEIPIAHCDLKPSNVLLDDELTGHVGDFGLAKFLSGASLDHPTNESTSIGVRGTIGYAPPEYGVGGEVSAYGDTYSYGILLLEMFTGKRPTDEMFREGSNLHNFVKRAVPEQVKQITDPTLLQEEPTGDDDKHEFSSIRNSRSLECLNSILRIGISCSVEFPRERMRISDAVAQLHSVRNELQ